MSRRLGLPAVVGYLAAGQLEAGAGWLVLLLALVIVTKVGVCYLLARLARLAARPWQLAVGLGQIGEFSFVLATIGLARGAISTGLYAAMLSVVAITIVASTVVVRLGGSPPAA